MKTLEKGQDKIKKICDTLKRETLEPAKQEADDIIKNAKERSEQIIKEAEAEAKKIIKEARLAVEQERNVFHSSLDQALKQTLEALKQEVEQKLFNESLEKIVSQHMSDPKVIANIINAVITAIEKEGLSKDFSAIVPKASSAESINRSLAVNILEQLKDHSVTLGPCTGGAQVKLIDKRMTIDISDQALCDYLISYVRKDFRKWLFASKGA